MRRALVCIVAMTSLGCHPFENSGLRNELSLRGARRVALVAVCQNDVVPDVIEAFAPALDRELAAAWKHGELVPLERSIGSRPPWSGRRCARGVDPFLANDPPTSVDSAYMAGLAKRASADVALAVIWWQPRLVIDGPRARMHAGAKNPMRVYAVDADGKPLGSVVVTDVEGEFAKDPETTFARAVARDLVARIQ